MSTPMNEQELEIEGPRTFTRLSSADGALVYVGHTKGAASQARLAELLRRAPALEALLETVEDFVRDHDNGLGPAVKRLREAITRARRER